MIKEELIAIIQELKDVSDKLGMEISNEVIFSEASGFLRGVYAGKNRSNSEETTKPTEKQIQFLTKQNIPVPETKKEAFNIIKEHIESKK